MASWSRNKVDSATINNGNEYEKGDRVSRQNLNAMVNSGLYAQDFAEKLVTNIDTSEIGNVGTPSIVLVDGDGATTNKPYKKFKFSNLKGDIGATGNGITNINKTSTSGLVDTYTITFTNGSTSSFDVSNGDSVDMRVFGGYFQWKRTQDVEWNNLIATSEIATVDQTLSSTSTNAIANKPVKEEFDKVVYKTNFNNSEATTFGDYIVEKKKVLWQGSQVIKKDGTVSININGAFEANTTYRMRCFFNAEFRNTYFKTDNVGALNNITINSTRLNIYNNGILPGLFTITTAIIYIDSNNLRTIKFNTPVRNTYKATAQGSTVAVEKYSEEISMIVYEIAKIIS